IEHLCHWSEAVGGAGSVRHDVVVSRVIVGVVHTYNECGIFVLTWSGDDDLLGAGVDMCLCLFSISEDTGRFDHDIGTEFSPGKFGGVGLCRGTESAATNSDGVIGVGNIFCQTTQN